MTSDRDLAVVIPAFEAGPSIGAVVREARRFLGNVLVVDDGSTDDTAAEAVRAGARLLRHPTNRGKGAALRTAFRDLFARGFERVITLDADGQHLPADIPAILNASRGGADLVIGSRTHLFGRMHSVRRVSNTLSSRAISAVAGRRLADVQSGFRLYTRRLLDATGFPESRFEAESAVVVRAARLGFAIAFVPISLGYADGRLTSHYRPVVDSARIFGAVTRARLERVRWPQERSS